MVNKLVDFSTIDDKGETSVAYQVNSGSNYIVLYIILYCIEINTDDTIFASQS